MTSVIMVIWITLSLFQNLSKSQQYVDCRPGAVVTDTIQLPDNTNTIIVAYNDSSDSFLLLGGSLLWYYNHEYIYSINNDSLEQITSFNQSFDTFNTFPSSMTTVYSMDAKDNIVSSAYFTNYIGDVYNTNYSNTNFWKFDLNSNEVLNIGKKYPKPQTPYGFECYCNDGIYIYVLGGLISYSPVKPPIAQTSVIRFDSTNNSWSILPDLIIGIASAWSACIYVDKQIFTFGTYDSTWGPLTNIQTLLLNNTNSSDQTWKVLQSQLTDPMLNPVAFYPVQNIVTNDDWRTNTILIMGGIDDYNGQFLGINCFNFRGHFPQRIKFCPPRGELIPTIFAPTGGYVFFNGQYRYYNFGTGTTLIQYIVLNCTDTTLI